MSPVDGNVDLLGPTPLKGWARSTDRPDGRLAVDVKLDDLPVAHTVADRHRSDLETAGVGDGRHGFEVDLAPHLDLAHEQILVVACRDSGETIWSGSTVELVRRATVLNDLRRRPLWAVNRLEIDGGFLDAAGYLVPAHGAPTPSAVFTLDGVVFEEIEYPCPSPSSAARLWYVPGCGRLGFRCRTSANRVAKLGGTIDCIDRATGRPLTDHGSFSIPPGFVDQLASVPEPERMQRVQGNDLADVHLLWGATARSRIDAFLHQHLGRGLRSFYSVLDWGCGCGRLTRHLSTVLGPRVTGADVDADTIDWCRNTIPGPRFETLPLTPPSGLTAASFDLVIGLSVMTHLREADQLAWLAELERLTAPGAVLLLTVNANTSMWWSDPPPDLIKEWSERGFSDRARDPALDGVIADDAYYRATFHREDYVRRVWGQHFDIITILPAFSHIQDMVVMRVRG